MKKRRYSASSFLFGFVLNLVRYWWLIALAVVSIILHFLIPSIPLLVTKIIVAIWLILAFVVQLILRRIALTSNHEAIDKLFSVKNDEESTDNDERK